jgi:hypothetical protein
MFFRIRIKSSIWSSFYAEVYTADEKLVYIVEEETGSLWRKIVRLTKFRTALALKVFIREVNSNCFYLFTRASGFSSNYFVKDGFGKTICEIKPVGMIIYSHYDILDEYGIVIGKYKYYNPFVLGPQKGGVKDNAGNVICEFEWERPRLLKSPRECKINIDKYERPWDIISIVVPILKAFGFEKR